MQYIGILLALQTILVSPHFPLLFFLSISFYLSFFLFFLFLSAFFFFHSLSLSLFIYLSICLPFNSSLLMILHTVLSLLIIFIPRMFSFILYQRWTSYADKVGEKVSHLVFNGMSANVQSFLDEVRHFHLFSTTNF